MASSDSSLRERQRDETWTAIHEAASKAALEVGLGAATVDVIATRAGISRRTFFNYFPTKEDAILGLREPTLTEDAVTDFRAARREVVGDAVHLMAAVMRTAGRREWQPSRRAPFFNSYRNSATASSSTLPRCSSSWNRS